METENKSLVKTSEVRLPKFVEDAYNTIEGMNKFANMLLDSKLVPDHFYEKGPDDKVDYTRGKTSSVVVVLLQAQQLMLSPMTALQNIVPINGLLSIKGDLAKTMIFASGKLKKDSWKETIEGSIENENMVVSITATREDNGLTITRSFSVDKAKRMGLWVTNQMISSEKGYKHKKSAWYKTPDRMIYYRTLGFLSRDLFPDVLNNMYITEEAIDIPKDTTEMIDAGNGKITLPDRQFSQERSDKMTARATKKIESKKFEPIQEAEKPKEESPVPEIQESKDESVKEQPVKKELLPGQFTIEQMAEMETSALLEMVNSDTEMIEAMEIIPGKNTNKKLREIIYAYQIEELDKHLASYRGQEKEQEGEISKEKESSDIPIQEIKPNKDFDKTQEIKTATNKYELEVPDFDKGQERDFATMKNLFNSLAGLDPAIDNNRWIILASKMGIYPQKYKSREDFCRFASNEEVNFLINSN